MKSPKSALLLIAWIGLLAMPASQLAGQETGEDPKPVESAEAAGTTQEEAAEDTVESVAADWQKLSREHSRKLREAASEERAAIAAERPKIEGYVERMMVLAKKDITGEEGKNALMWIIRNARDGASENATDLMIEHHSNAPEITTVMLGKSRQNPTESSLAWLDNLIANSDSQRIRGLASYARALQLKQGYAMWVFYGELITRAETMTEEDFAAANRGRSREDAITMASRFRNAMPAEVQEMYVDESTFVATIDAAFVKIVEEFGDVKTSDAEDSPTLGDRVESELFELRYLTIGKEAPDIEAEDIDGVAFRLSDYRGKVVVIDFWGDW